MYLIVVGAGDIGTRVIDVATSRGHEVVVIEQDEKRAKRAKADYDATVIHASATTHDIFAESDPEKADAVISTTEEDATNLMVMMLARRFEIPTLVSVVHDPKHMAFFDELGVNVMQNPQQVIAERLVASVETPSIKDYLELEGDAEIFEIMVEEGAPIAGETVTSARTEDLIPADSIIIAVERGDETLSGRRDVEIRVDDLVTVFSHSGATSDILAPFERAD